MEEALHFKDKTFDYLHDNDPTLAIEKIFNALIFSHAKVVRDNKGLTPDAYVNPSETYIGKFISSRIYTQGICTKCNKSDWIVREAQLFPIHANQVI